MSQDKVWTINGEQRRIEPSFGIKYEQLLIKLLGNAGEVMGESETLAMWLLANDKVDDFVGIVTCVIDKDWNGTRVDCSTMSFEMLVEVVSDFLDTITDVLKTSLIKYAAILDMQKERQKMTSRHIQAMIGK